MYTYTCIYIFLHGLRRTFLAINLTIAPKHHTSAQHKHKFILINFARSTRARALVGKRAPYTCNLSTYNCAGGQLLAGMVVFSAPKIVVWWMSTPHDPKMKRCWDIKHRPGTTYIWVGAMKSFRHIEKHIARTKSKVNFNWSLYTDW